MSYTKIVSCIQIALVVYFFNNQEIFSDHLLTVFNYFIGIIAVTILLPHRYRPYTLLACWPIVLYAAGGVILLLPFLTLGTVGACVVLPRYKLILKGVILAALLGGAVLINHAVFSWEYLPANSFSIWWGVFVFRAVDYLHHQKHHKDSVPLITKLGYLFSFNLGPNFILFSFKNFIRKKSNLNDELFTKGAYFIFLGAFQIAIYKVIQDITPDIECSNDLLTLLLYLICNYMLILQISGVIHICVGAHCFWGYDLPPAFNNFLLAQSFSDFWKRLNIYWKDFITKIVYYPVYFGLRKSGLSYTALTLISIMTAFAVTMTLHHFQWFWTTGSSIPNGTDFFFWGTFAALVIINVLRPKVVKLPSPSIGYGLRVTGTFLTISLLWFIWTSASTETAFVILLSTKLSGSGILGAVAIIASAAAALSIGHFLHARKSIPKQLHYVAQYGMAAFFLVGALSSPWQFKSSVVGRYQEAFKAFQSGVFTTDDAFTMYEVRVNFYSLEKASNDAGMIDRRYDPNSNSLKIVLLGSSIESGQYIPYESDFESVLEEMLNNDMPVEIHNLAVPSATFVQHLHIVRDRVVGEGYHEVILCHHDVEIMLLRYILETKKLDVDIDDKVRDPYLMELFKTEFPRKKLYELTASETYHVFEKHNRSIISHYLEKIYKELASDGIQPIFLKIPVLNWNEDPSVYKSSMEIAENIGYQCIDLSNFYEGKDIRPMVVNMDRYQHYPNEATHRIIAERIYPEILEIISK